MWQEWGPRKFCDEGHEIAKDFITVFGTKKICGICHRRRSRKNINKAINCEKRKAAVVKRQTQRT